MKIKKELLLQFLKETAKTHEDFASEMEVPLSVVEQMLNGEAVCKDTARKFFCCFGAIEGARFVDWEAIGIENPLPI